MATPTTETAIWLALRARVEALTLSPAFPIAWPNEPFTPLAGGYLKVEHIPNRTLRRFIGSNDPHHYRGILQIGVMAKLNQNVAVGIEVAGDVAGHFPADLRLTSNGITVRITSHPSVGPAQPQATHVMIPVSIEYEAWA
jgi:hypothetical protein